MHVWCYNDVKLSFEVKFGFKGLKLMETGPMWDILNSFIDQYETNTSGMHSVLNHSIGEL